MERGIKFFLPGPSDREMADFTEVLRLVRRLGYGFVMLELGGAMPYARHPEINAAWLKYTAFMNEYPGKTQVIQNSQRWAKNSIHTDNGHGQVLSRGQVEALVDCCREIGLEIVPEVPLLSHADYLLLAHPDLAERPEDPYPDAACSLHPAYFPLVQDILEEVVALFRPRRINIGHDECYSIGLCPRCRGHEAPRLYADEINRTAALLRGMGVATMMWAEKLLDAHFPKGDAIGGAEIPATPSCEGRAALHPCGPLLDKDIQMLHWYWSIDRRYDRRFEELGLDFWYGNFSPALMPDMASRLASPRCKGFVVSNWGATDLTTMQRNGILYNIFYAALATDGEHDPDDFGTLDAAARKEVCRLMAPKGPTVEIVHTTHSLRKYRHFYDGYYLDERFYRMGDHILEDETGARHRLPVIFGRHLSNDDVRLGRWTDASGFYDTYALDMLALETTGTALPFRAEDGRVFYRTAYPHPAPGHRLRYVRFEPASAFVPPVEVQGQPEEASDPARGVVIEG